MPPRRCHRMCAAFHWARGRPAAERVVMCSPFPPRVPVLVPGNGPCTTKDETSACLNRLMAPACPSSVFAPLLSWVRRLAKLGCSRGSERRVVASRAEGSSDSRPRRHRSDTARTPHTRLHRSSEHIRTHAGAANEHPMQLAAARSLAAFCELTAGWLAHSGGASSGTLLLALPPPVFRGT